MNSGQLRRLDKCLRISNGNLKRIVVPEQLRRRVLESIQLTTPFRTEGNTQVPPKLLLLAENGTGQGEILSWMPGLSTRKAFGRRERRDDYQ